MNITQILFWALSIISLFSAIMVITSRNPVYSVLWLIITFFSISGHYILLNAQFLAIVNIIVYAGAIMVLFLFVIMLVNLDLAAKERQFSRGWAIAGVAVLAVAAEFGYFLYKGAGEFHIAEAAPAPVPSLGNTEMIADSLFQQYLLPFEIASILLLVAVVGSVVMAKKRI